MPLTPFPNVMLPGDSAEILNRYSARPMPNLNVMLFGDSAEIIYRYSTGPSRQIPTV